MSKPKLLYLLTEDWFFCSHFIERALATQSAGYEVVVVAREQSHGERIRSAGLRFIALGFERRSMNPLKELRLLAKIWLLYLRERPSIVHQVSAKPILYGSMAARMARVPSIVNAPVGMGYVFSSNDRTARLLRPFVRLAYRFLANPPHSRVIFENRDDLSSFVNWGAVRATDAVLIRGAGINVEKFQPAYKHPDTPVVMLIARMLRDKGVVEFVAAAHRLHAQNISARFILVGAPDPLNPSSLSSEMLRSWQGECGIEYWSWREDIAQVLSEASIVCLPSYREGLPKVLLEAAACGLPIVTTDTTGCREVVIDGDNGFLVPVKDANALADALKRLIQDPALCLRMGARGRHRAEVEFSSARIIRETLAVYSDLSSLPTH